MRIKEERVVVTFFTTAEAMAMERLCKARNLEGKLISAPRSISADCGIAWSAPARLEQELHRVTAEAGVETQGFYRMSL